LLSKASRWSDESALVIDGGRAANVCDSKQMQVSPDPNGGYEAVTELRKHVISRRSVDCRMLTVIPVGKSWWLVCVCVMVGGWCSRETPLPLRSGVEDHRQKASADTRSDEE
jgi:hypothetical protein